MNPSPGTHLITDGQLANTELVEPTISSSSKKISISISEQHHSSSEHQHSSISVDTGQKIDVVQKDIIQQGEGGSNAEQQTNKELGGKHGPSAEEPLYLNSIGSNQPKPFKLQGKLGGYAARILIDSGASSEFISTKFTLKHKLYLSESSRSIKLADGSVVSAVGQISLKCELDSSEGQPLKFTSELTATDLDGYDAILRTPWLARHNPLIDWKDRTMKLGHDDGSKTLIKPLEEKSNSQTKELAFMSNKALTKALRKGKIEELYVVEA